MVVGHDDLLGPAPTHAMSMQCQSNDGIVLKIKTADFAKFKRLACFNLLSAAEQHRILKSRKKDGVLNSGQLNAEAKAEYNEPDLQSPKT